MAKRKSKKGKVLNGVRIPLPKQTGGKHKVKTKYDRKRVKNLMAGLEGSWIVDQMQRGVYGRET